MNLEFAPVSLSAAYSDIREALTSECLVLLLMGEEHSMGGRCDERLLARIRLYY